MMERTNVESVRLSPTISDGQVDYVTQRKRRMQKWLNSEGINCELADVPNIALLGSGGGLRAAVGLLGSLRQLKEDNLLDGLLYMCGVSGSTWCMSSLYKDPEWSKNGQRVEQVIETLKGPEVDFATAVKWLRARKEQDPDFSLTHFWAAISTSYFMKEMDGRLLSPEAIRDSSNPYPIYTAIELDLNRKSTIGTWFEVTPHESGYSALGAFISTSDFRSKFEAGVLTERREEMDVILLQGMCGSFLGDGQRNIEELKNWIKNWIWHFIHGGVKSFDLQMTRQGLVTGDMSPVQVVRRVFELIKYAEDPQAQMENRQILDIINTLGQSLEGQLNCDGGRLWNMDVETWQKSSLAERRAFIDTVSTELLLCPDTWAQSREDPVNTSTRSNSSWFVSDALWVLVNIRPLIHGWKWGTTSNFLYQSKDSHHPSRLVKEEKVHLIDAGLNINSPYPPVLRPGREVDLIISLDFSEGDPFETLFSAKEYAKEQCLPFPEVEEEVRKDKERPQDCYVFQSGHANGPTVMHLPLFNLQNCQGEDGIKEMWKQYATLRRSYSPEELQQLLEKAQVNMRNARQRILEQIKAAVLRRQKSKTL